ncbi:MAG TPA: DegT/DnrJ/EryC1/StrS family aminotransferase [Thermotogota bacterium]|nr:DegT/DnrJ/EryC1/StrS family aminotransferase [Thermotogota bacterium]HNR63720.1 DegT/DnrJ/EryC1/StrS family aminotransferase [Thermotogota bacterium]HNT95743.1 DegT/DnrJ/EryC1/StrS family aminotransferase [Thermotogota bacterium]HOZ11849.1 DegT/DnrJ/EryC1/StrS family aminotransferase [Thermotogota bacterium]HPB86619.1 DegT/DnrJ/EryC1/StrS family aminotransferase [Thermotogota bacterium]
MIKKTVPLSSPDIGEEEVRAVEQVLRSSILSIGPKVQEFEKLVSEYSGLRYCVAVNSGTSALMLIMKAAGVTVGDRYLTTPFSFVTSSNILLYEGAEPVFVDIDPLTFNMDVRQLEQRYAEDPAKETIKGIVGVDVFAQPLDWDPILDFTQKTGLKVIEDSCEALGSSYKGKNCGSFGSAGAFAFYPNKQMTTGEGGVVVTDDEEIYQLCRSMRNQGRGVAENWLEHVRLGYNFRMDELNAALGIEQVKKLDHFIVKRNAVAERYAMLFSGVSGVRTPVVETYTTRISWFVYVVMLDEGIDRDGIIGYLQERGIQSRNYFAPIHLQPFYKERFGYREGMLPITENVTKRTLAIPFYNNLTVEDQEYVVHTLKEGIERFS